MARSRGSRSGPTACPATPTLFDDPGLINTLLPRYLAVTAEDIRDAARAVFRADNRVVLTYVPAAAAGAGEPGAEEAA